jgi:uncharacterized membrane protein
MNEQNVPQPPANLPEPAVSNLFQHGWETMKKNFPELLLVFFLQLLLSLPASFSNVFRSDDFSYGMGFYALLSVVFGIIVMLPVSYGCNWVFLKAVRGESFKVTDIFFAFQSFLNVIISALLVGVIICAGFILLIVPGIIFACKLVFVPYLVIDEKMEATEAIRKSWKMTKGFSWTIFWLAIVSFFIVIAGLICLVVGVIPAVIWIELTFAAIYWIVSAKAKAIPLVSQQ